MRSTNHVYNQSLLAALLEHWGAEKTREWVKGIAENLAHPPNGGDRDQIRAVARGECDLTLVNTYYYAAMLGGSDPEQRALAKKVALLWPDQNGVGVHVNISVGAVLKSARHPEAAAQCLEFLVRHAQRLFAALNDEYPIVIGIPVSDILLKMGPFKADSLPLSRLGQHRKEVKILLEDVGWR
jgi:iron(III) transport system substrate-binding protein